MYVEMVQVDNFCFIIAEAKVGFMVCIYEQDRGIDPLLLYSLIFNNGIPRMVIYYLSVAPPLVIMQHPLGFLIWSTHSVLSAAAVMW